MKGCLKCDGSTKCLECDPLAFELDTTSALCKVKVCQGSYYNLGEGCKPCNSTCKTCSGPSGEQCSSCDTSSKLMNGKCICKDIKK